MVMRQKVNAWSANERRSARKRLRLKQKVNAWRENVSEKLKPNG